jgi:glycosyltransferase involved in cell wall biosynthesis
MKPKVSVIIPTYNEKERVAKCIESLLSQSYPQDKIEIIVVDDGSTDGTSSFIKKNFPKVKLITKKNSGAYDSRNKGIAAASGEIIALTDSDCIPSPKWVEKFVNILEKGKIKIVGGKIPHNKHAFMAKAIGISDFGGFQENYKKNNVTCIPTCNLAAKKEIFEKFQFDSNLRSAGDRLFSWNLIETGYKLYYQPSVEVAHEPSLKFSSFLRRKYVYGKDFVLIRQMLDSLPWAKLIKFHIPGLIIISGARFLLDLYRMFKYWKIYEIKSYEAIPLVIIFFIGRLVFLWGCSSQIMGIDS